MAAGRAAHVAAPRRDARREGGGAVLTPTLLHPPPDEEVLGFLERTVSKLRADDDVPTAVVVTVLYRGRTYSIHSFGVHEAGTLAMVGVMEAAKMRLLRPITEGEAT